MVCNTSIHRFKSGLRLSKRALKTLCFRGFCYFRHFFVLLFHTVNQQFVFIQFLLDFRFCLSGKFFRCHPLSVIPSNPASTAVFEDAAISLITFSFAIINAPFMEKTTLLRMNRFFVSVLYYRNRCANPVIISILQKICSGNMEMQTKI